MSESIETFRAMLRVSKHQLDDHLEVQAEVLDRIGQRCAALKRRVSEAHEYMRQHEAHVMSARKAAGDAAVLAEKTARADPERARRYTLELDAAQELAEWESLYEAWKSRGFSMKELTQLHTDQYFTHSATGNVDRGERRQSPPRVDYSAQRAKPRARIE